MKTVYQSKYGPTTELKIVEAELPKIKENEVLIKVYATAINDYDWSMLRGKPYLYRLMFGLFQPKNKVTGMELSGRVEAIGNKVNRFKEGDAVYGDISNYGFGSFGEYLAIDQNAVIPKPKHISFEEAAALAHAGGLALQGLEEMGSLKEGEKILINGAGGGMGLLGVQIAKQKGAIVTGVDHFDKLEFMRKYGFHEVIDYTTTDFTKLDDQYDLILDAKTTRSPFSYVKVLKPNGRYVTVGGSLNRLLQLVFLKTWIQMRYHKKFSIVALKPNKDMDFLEKMAADKQLLFPLEIFYGIASIPKALERFGRAKHIGKVVVNLSQN